MEYEFKKDKYTLKSSIGFEKITSVFEMIGTVLFGLFVILKLADIITWSWWFIFAPILITYGGPIILIVVTEFKTLLIKKHFNKKSK